MSTATLGASSAPRTDPFPAVAHRVTARPTPASTPTPPATARPTDAPHPRPPPPSAPAAELRPGDVNCDGAVDAGDLLVVRGGANWQQPTGSAAEPRADVNTDGAVDAGDLLVIRGGAVWQTSTGPCTCP